MFRLHEILYNKIYHCIEFFLLSRKSTIEIGESSIRYSIFCLFKNSHKTLQNGLNGHMVMSSQYFYVLNCIAVLKEDLNIFSGGFLDPELFGIVVKLINVFYPCELRIFSAPRSRNETLSYSYFVVHRR
jgi:hypothetical protein